MRTRNIYKVVVSIILAWSYFFLPKYGYATVSGFPIDYTSHLLYPISHANIWHLLANIICLWMLPCRLHLIATYSIAVLCSLIPCLTSEPTMGFSGILFAIVGISWGKTKHFRNMMWKNKWFLIIPMFIPHVNAFIHLYCLLVGYVYGYLICARKLETS